MGLEPIEKGSAFGVHHPDIPPGYQGMSLRDYFAAAALTGMKLTHWHANELNQFPSESEALKDYQRRQARACYGYADAMIAVRAKESK